MTIEEAIEYNKNLREYMRITDKESEYKFLKENYEALDLAIKADYEARLKADLEAILVELQLEIEELNTPPAYQDEDYFLIGTNRCSELIQQKIDKLKGEQNV